MTAMEKLREVGAKLRDSGIPTILLQDPLTKLPSLTFTMVAVSFGMCLLALMGKTVALLGGLDYQNCKDLLTITGVGYLGRQGQKLFEDKESNKEGENK